MSLNMTRSTLAPSSKHHAPGDDPIHDPFVTPMSSRNLWPALPQPVLQKPSSIHSELPPTDHQRASVAHGSRRHHRVDSAYRSRSMSTTGERFTITSISSVDPERRSKTQISSRDPEKAEYSPDRDSSQHYRRARAMHIQYSEEDEIPEAWQLQEKNGIKILLFLALPCTIMSLLNAFWALTSITVTLLSQPVRLCAKRPTFGEQICGLLGPSLSLHLRCIYTPLPSHANEESSFRPGMLLTVQLLSPFLSLAMMLAAWVTAIFWLSSASIGDPAGTDGRDDGKDAVMWLRRRWERWLLKGMTDDLFEG